LGEGSAILALEDLDSALKRRANIYAEIKGFASVLDKDQGLARAMKGALKNSKLNPSDIDLICAGANSSIETDLEEAEAIKNIFGEASKKVSVSAVKSMIGEQYSNSGALLASVAALAIQRQVIPPTINYQEKDAAIDLNIVTKPQSAKVNNVLIDAYGKGGCSSSMVISKFEK
jgi:3-oxoacyl-(acyl-carrier-protein) synthase